MTCLGGAVKSLEGSRLRAPEPVATTEAELARRSEALVL